MMSVIAVFFAGTRPGNAVGCWRGLKGRDMPARVGEWSEAT